MVGTIVSPNPTDLVVVGVVSEIIVPPHPTDLGCCGIVSEIKESLDKCR